MNAFRDQGSGLPSTDGFCQTPPSLSPSQKFPGKGRIKSGSPCRAFLSMSPDATKIFEKERWLPQSICEKSSSLTCCIEAINVVRAASAAR